jgi:hypothetical protein
MMPILHSPGLMMPGQLGPIRRVLLCSLIAFFTLTCATAISRKQVYQKRHARMRAVRLVQHCCDQDLRGSSTSNRSIISSSMRTGCSWG